MSDAKPSLDRLGNRRVVGEFFFFLSLLLTGSDVEDGREIATRNCLAEQKALTGVG